LARKSERSYHGVADIQSHHSSKEAYLLLYARENVSTTSDVSTQPSAEVMSVIVDLNDKFKSQVDEYQTRSVVSVYMAILILPGQRRLKKRS
jgi:hypothetical protein